VLADLQARTLCVMLFRDVTKSIAHRVRSYKLRAGLRSLRKGLVRAGRSPALFKHKACP
jgi:hypothetical protein